VRTEACRAARGLKDPEVRQSVLNVIASAYDQWQIRPAYNTACGLGARLEALEILAARLDDPAAGLICLPSLIDFAIENCGSSGVRKLDPAVARKLKASWTKLLHDHRQAIKASRRFKIGGPELTPDLLPPGYKLYPRGGKPWP